MKFTSIKKDYADVTTLSDDDIICYCIKVDKKTIVSAIRKGSTTLKAVKDVTSACTGDECTIVNPNKRCCSKEITQLLKQGEPHEQKRI